MQMESWPGPEQLCSHPRQGRAAHECAHFRMVRQRAGLQNNPPDHLLAWKTHQLPAASAPGLWERQPWGGRDRLPVQAGLARREQTGKLGWAPLCLLSAARTGSCCLLLRSKLE